MSLRKVVATRVAPLAAAAVVSSAAFGQATAVDVSDAVAQIDTMATTLPLIGGALMVIAAIAVTLKWAKAAIFG